MTPLFKNIRFYILLFSACLAATVYLYVINTFPAGTSQITKLTQYYALIAVTYLYLALLATPLTSIFSDFPLRNKYLKARRAIGVSTFFFATLHASFAFFGQLGGFSGLFYLSEKYILAISLSFMALVILSLMAMTSFDFMVAKLTFPRWKKLHRFVYLAALAILIHALMLGSHFIDLADVIPQIFFSGLVILIFLESIRFDGYLRERFSNLPTFGVPLIMISFVLGGLVFLYLTPRNSPISLGIHAQHIQLAQEAQKQSSSSQTSQIPGLQGDKTKRYTVSFLHPDEIRPNQDVTLKFEVFDASNGNPTALYARLYEKVAHLIIVDQTLQFFEHIHPDQTPNGFTITTKFPAEGRYHLYLDFQPLGAIEQQMGFVLDVGKVDTSQKAVLSNPTEYTKDFGDYKVKLDFPTPLKSSLISVGGQKFTYTLTDAKTGAPVTNIKPYLGAFGHLVMINTETYEYVHVHPNNLFAPPPDANGGPSVEFLPLGIYGPIKPGTYKLYGQFNPGGNLMVTDFIIRVE